MKNFFHMLREDIKELVTPVKPFTVFDYAVLLAVVAAAFLLLASPLIVQTAGVSFGFLNRRFLDFYEYAKECRMQTFCYMPAVYLIYAVWNLPLKLTFLVRYPMPEAPYFVLLWYKLLLLLVYAACAYLVYKLALEIGMGIKKAKLCALAAFTMPVGFFLLFSQVMLFPLFFVLLGLLFYLKNKRWGFVACFAAAIALEQFVWVLFLPLLLLKEKRLWRLCADIVAAAVPFLAEYLLYRESSVFLQNVELFDINKSFKAGLNIGIFEIQYVVFFFILILGWAYFTGTKTKRELTGYALFFAGLSGVLTLCLTDWKAEYFMFLVPLGVLGAFLHRDLRIFMILDIGWAGLMAVYVVCRQMELGSIGMVASLYTVLLILIVAFKHPAFLEEKADELPPVCTGWLRTRFLAGAVLCVVPVVVNMLQAI